MIKKYNVSGFDCAHCASRAEEFLNKDPKINKCNINFAASLMTVDFKDEIYTEKQLMEIIYNLLSENVKVQERVKNSNYRVKVFNKKVKSLFIRIVISVFLIIPAMILQFRFVENKFDTSYIVMMVLYLLAYILLSYDILWDLIKSFKNIKSFFGKSTLMEIASIGALILQNYMEAVMVVLLGQIGDLLEEISINKSKNLIVEAIDKREKYSTLFKNGEYIKIESNQIKENDVVSINVGEIVPTDGVILNGEGEFDTSSLTGEFIPYKGIEGNEILSGYVLTNGNVLFKATKDFNDSTTAKILDLVIESASEKTKAEKFISKFAKFYTPIMFLIAVIVATIPPLIISLLNSFVWDIWNQWIYYALTLLVIACPCAILISVPLAYFTGVGLASKHGILIKGTNYLDRINNIKKFIMDKTGTLTNGKFSIVAKDIFALTEEEFESYFYALEFKSSHPIAKAILKEFSNKKEYKIPLVIEEIKGQGIKGIINKKEVLAVNDNYLILNNFNYKKVNINGTKINLIVDKKLVGFICLEDEIKSNSFNFIKYLKTKNIEPILLTGGREESANFAAKTLQISNFRANLLPNDKLDILKNEIKNKKRKGDAVAFVGDGVNDAPSIVAADISFAMGGLGSDVSVDSADVVITNDDPIKISQSFEIAKKTRIRALVDIVVALIIKFSIMILSLPQINIVKDMWIAVLVDSGLAVLLIVYSLLLIKSKIKNKNIFF